MTPLILENPANLRDLVLRCKVALLCGERFGYAEIDGGWADFRKKINEKINMYVVWTRDPGEAMWRPRYLGQAWSGEIGNRIHAHLVNAGKDTGSVPDKVKQALSNGHEVAASFAMVKPEALRRSVEEIILALKPDLFDWNRRRVDADAEEWVRQEIFPDSGGSSFSSSGLHKTSIDETIAALKRDRGRRPPVSAAEIRAARDTGRP